MLEAPDREALLQWVREQPLARVHEHGGQTLLMVHAGVLPTWSAADTLARASEVQALLRGPDLPDFLHAMYGNTPDQWDDGLVGNDRLRVIVNALTRLRFCTPDGVMDLKASGGLDQAPPGYLPWFDVPGRRSANLRIAFGHWSTLGFIKRPDIIALDTGCVWGGCLSALRLDNEELIQVQCEQARAPGE